MLERSLNAQHPGSALDHLDQFINPDLGRRPSVNFPPFSQSTSHAFQSTSGTSPDVQMIWDWQPSDTTEVFGNSITDALPIDTRRRDHSSPIDHAGANSAPSSLVSTGIPHQASGRNPDTSEPISIPIAASFFRIYFQFIHPQYPFLDIQQCGKWYQEWKSCSKQTQLGKSAGFFVRMV